jgi:hypothetical protein
MEVMVPPVTVKSRPATADKVAQSMSSLPVTVNTGLLVDCDAEGDVRVRIGGVTSSGVTEFVARLCAPLPMALRALILK